MKSNNIELEPGMERKIKISFAVFFGFIIRVIIIYQYFYGEENVKKQLLHIENHSRVIDIYNNQKEHNFLFVKYSNGRKNILEFNYKIGDSISKNKGDSIEYIFRNGKIIENNLFDEYRRNGGKN
ncbi:hypothetical protein ACNFU2_21685 [Chryseobacterium sp. PTM-20240506]|uniref:hypothetical protein n=1 Tax=unclassified Chryseobacterium TaxID=2593645 RepID=UPI002359CA38|nr:MULTISPECIES: hypothetical protein [unclassified Chryseobacterium]MDC8103206.1 hypothetical protein [Chryseobacterium sp. B21-037]MDQ1802758.1 hypothetical protein [Chryseobacterium sp. CKR4-1]